MADRTGIQPETAQTYLERICAALDYTPRELAKFIGVAYKDLEPLLRPLNEVADINKDNVWWLIAAFVDRRMAAHLAVKAELNRALTQQRTQQAARLAQLRSRPSVPPPTRRPPLQSRR